MILWAGCPPYCKLDKGILSAFPHTETITKDKKPEPVNKDNEENFTTTVKRRIKREKYVSKTSIFERLIRFCNLEDPRSDEDVTDDN